MSEEPNGQSTSRGGKSTSPDDAPSSSDDVRFDPDPGFVDDVDERTAGLENTEQEASNERIVAAIGEVRREVRNVAVLYATVEAALAALLVNLLLRLADPQWLAASVPIPGVAADALGGVPLLGDALPTALPATALVGIAVGVLAFAVAYGLRVRRPLVEQFEAANPQLGEALRTARDAVDDGADTEMARRLYGDVIETLGSASTLELVETRRVVVTLALVALVSVASVQVAVVNPDLAGLLGVGAEPTVDRPDDDGLQDGDEILGDPEDVGAGDDQENISVPGTGEGSADGPTGSDGGFGGGGGTGAFDSQQSGYAGQERIEDAELVREYNLRIREFDDANAGSDDSDTDTSDAT
ncbi:DUF7502 family protein [Halobellus rufus]|uniref:DUF7502 family protein n=1 Tax=Halobellus rufus TaxID=1448860 RepID=UPI0006793D2C|nr:hypothetical protein [Halobellus rufus]